MVAACCDGGDCGAGEHGGGGAEVGDEGRGAALRLRRPRHTARDPDLPTLIWVPTTRRETNLHAALAHTGTVSHPGWTSQPRRTQPGTPTRASSAAVEQQHLVIAKPVREVAVLAGGAAAEASGLLGGSDDRTGRQSTYVVDITAPKP